MCHYGRTIFFLVKKMTISFAGIVRQLILEISKFIFNYSKLSLHFPPTRSVKSRLRKKFRPYSKYLFVRFQKICKVLFLFLHLHFYMQLSFSFICQTLLIFFWLFFNHLLQIVHCNYIFKYCVQHCKNQMFLFYSVPIVIQFVLF